MCIPRQMSAILNIDFGTIVNELDEIQRELYGPGDRRGYLPAAVLEYAKLSGLACAVVHNGNTIEACEGNSPILCFCVLETHSYFYSCQKAAKALLKRQPINKKNVKMKKEYKGSSPPFSEWKPWQHEMEPGHYYTADESISSVRAWFLQSGRIPLVMLTGDGFNVKSLIYDLLPAFDKASSGRIFIHSVPDNAWEINEQVRRERSAFMWLHCWRIPGRVFSAVNLCVDSPNTV